MATTMEKALLEAYGPTMDLKEVARTLKRNPDAVRKALSGDQSPWWAQALKLARLPNQPRQKFIFRTADVATVLDTPVEQQTVETLNDRQQHLTARITHG